ncbi:MAG: CpaF family protein [Actinomycetia bacterium]|nr:CpaF family protein [Actinomycetes bacterium]
MSLGERLRAANGDEEPEKVLVPIATSNDATAREERGPVDPFGSLKMRAQGALFDRLGSRLFDPDLDEEELRDLVGKELTEVLETEASALTTDERAMVVEQICADVLGHGPIDDLLADEAVTEIMVNGTQRIFVERSGRLQQTDARYLTDEHLRRVIERIVARVGRRVDESSPMVDARLPDGSRVNAIIPPLAVDGSALTIRKFAKRALSSDDLVANGSASSEVMDFLEGCVRGKLNVLVSGGTGSGKTTLLNIVSSFIPDDERLVTVEDAVELRLAQSHVVRLESRPPNIEGKGAISIRDLVRNALRMRPDRIIVGEVRSGEALDMLQAMNTGHEGSLSTLHANTPRDAISRLETMVLMSGIELPVRAIREQIASALDLIVQIGRLRDGTRRLVKISEVNGLEGDIVTLTDLFELEYIGGEDENGRLNADLSPTGLRPQFDQRLADHGITFAPELFQGGLGGEAGVASELSGWLDKRSLGEVR